MKNWIKSVDIDQVKDQIADLRGQIGSLHFRKPWTRGKSTSPFVYLAIGAALAYAASLLYSRRKEVAELCSSCGAKLKDTLESTGLKNKAEKVVGKVKEGLEEAVGSTENGRDLRYAS